MNLNNFETIAKKLTNVHKSFFDNILSVNNIIFARVQCMFKR